MIPRPAANVLRYEFIQHSPSALQCRRMSLFQIVSQREALGQHKIRTLSQVEASRIKSPKDIEFELWSSEPLRLIKKITVEEALEEHIRPGFVLAPLNDKQEPKSVGRIPTKFEIVKLKVDNKPEKKAKRGGKMIIFLPDTSAGHVQQRLQKIYDFLKEREQVEFHLRGLKEWKILTDEQLDTLLNDCIHMRPDVLLKAMPEGSGQVISLITDRKKIMWGAQGRVKMSDMRQERLIFKKREVQFERERRGIGYLTHAERLLHRAATREREGNPIFTLSSKAGSALKRAKDILANAKEYGMYLDKVRHEELKKPSRSANAKKPMNIIDRSERRAAENGKLQLQYPGLQLPNPISPDGGKAASTADSELDQKLRAEYSSTHEAVDRDAGSLHTRTTASKEPALLPRWIGRGSLAARKARPFQMSETHNTHARFAGRDWTRRATPDKFSSREDLSSGKSRSLQTREATNAPFQSSSREDRSSRESRPWSRHVTGESEYIARPNSKRPSNAEKTLHSLPDRNATGAAARLSSSWKTMSWRETKTLPRRFSPALLKTTERPYKGKQESALGVSSRSTMLPGRLQSPDSGGSREQS